MHPRIRTESCVVEWLVELSGGVVVLLTSNLSSQAQSIPWSVLEVRFVLYLVAVPHLVSTSLHNQGG